MNYAVHKKESFAIVDSVRNFRRVLQVHPVTIVADHKPLTGFLKTLHTIPMLISWQESLCQLDTSIEHLQDKKDVTGDACSRIYNPIKIPPTRDSFSPPDNRYSYTAQLPVITNHLTLPTPYLHIPLLIITSCTTIPIQTKNRLTAGNSTRRYDEDDSEYRECLDINHQEDDTTRVLTNQLQQAARANRQPFSTLSATAVNGLRQAASSTAVSTNATTTRAQAQQQRCVIEEHKPRKLLHSIVINNQPSLLNRPPTTRPNHIHLNQLGAGEISTGRSIPFVGPSQHRNTTSLIQELSAVDFNTDEEPESREEDMADDGEASEIG